MDLNSLIYTGVYGDVSLYFIIHSKPVLQESDLQHLTRGREGALIIP